MNFPKIFVHPKTYLKLKHLFLFLFLVGMTACGAGEDKPDKDKILGNENQEETEENSSNPRISKEVLSDIITSIPSPLEISFLIKELGIQYDREILTAKNRDASNYKTEFEQALNLGVYSTDLGYANIYQETQDALEFLGNVNAMADELGIGEYFDFKTIKELAEKSDNLDSLLIVTSTNLESINEHLQQKDRSDLTILILTGGWLEALYVTCEVANKTEGNELLNNRIGEQKVILDQLVLLLSFYEQEYANIKKLKEQLAELQQIYNDVEMSFKYEESTTHETDDGILVVEENTTSQFNLTKENLTNILNKTREIRQSIIKK